MKLHSLHKWLIGAILFMLPDDRPRTRRAVMRAGVWMRHQNGQITLAQRQRLIKKSPPEYRTWIAVGAGILMMCIQHTLSVLLFLLVIGYAIFSFVDFIVQRMWG